MMLNIFGELEGLTASLYDYRHVIIPLLILFGLAALVTAYRIGTHRLLLRHRLATGLIGVPALILAVVAGDYLVAPLWERSRLDEPSPVMAMAGDLPAAAPAPASMPASPASPATARVSHTGMFMGADSFHFGRGDAQIIQAPDGKLVLRFENFSVRNGPDLFVYLSRDESGRRVDEALNLGVLKATDGAFNYEIPATIDIATIKSAVVWCRQFATLFAVATLKTS